MTRRLEVPLGALCALAAVALIGCGAKSGDEPIGVTFNPPTLSETFPQGQVGTTLFVMATLNPVPPGTTYAYLQDPQGILSPGPWSVTDEGHGSYQVDLPLQDGLTVGVHRGTFTLELCKDAGCAEPYPVSGGSLPYTFDVTGVVTTTATATISVDGVLQAGTGGTLDGNGARDYTVALATGSTLQIVTTAPIATWSFSSGAPLATIVPFATNTPTSFQAHVSLSSSSDVSEASTLDATTDDGQLFHFALTVTN